MASGTHVLSWAQTEVDGIRAAPLDGLTAGASWRWTGQAVRIDGAASALMLDGDDDAAALRRGAAQMVRRLIGVIPTDPRPHVAEETADDLPEQGFVVTDGRTAHAATLIDVPDTGSRLLMFVGSLPQADRDHWVVRVSIGHAPLAGASAQSGGVICFTPGTRIYTPSGPIAIDALRPGMRILTKDNGPQEVLWTGRRHMTGARLHAMPHLRPIRFRTGALGIGRPDDELVVSPQHRMLVRTPSARDLFNAPEVLVAAEHLIDHQAVTVDHALREVTYVHLLLERHNIVWANGLETESFHPCNTSLDMIAPHEREGLLALLPGIAADPQTYGDYARRNISASEAAILRHHPAA